MREDRRRHSTGCAWRMQIARSRAATPPGCRLRLAMSSPACASDQPRTFCKYRATPLPRSHFWPISAALSTSASTAHDTGCARHGTARVARHGYDGSRHALLMPREAGCRERPPDRHAEDLGQCMKPVLDPLASVLKRPAGQPTLSAQERSTHTARDPAKGTERSARNQD